MVRCGVSPSGSGNVAAQDETVSLSAADMHSASKAEEELLSPFANISAVICDHSYLATCFGDLVDNAPFLHFRVCCQKNSEKAVL